MNNSGPCGNGTSDLCVRSRRSNRLSHQAALPFVFFLLYCTGEHFITLWNTSGECGYPCLRGKAFNPSAVSVMWAVGFCGCSLSSWGSSSLDLLCREVFSYTRERFCQCFSPWIGRIFLVQPGLYSLSFMKATFMAIEFSVPIFLGTWKMFHCLLVCITLDKKPAVILTFVLL